VAGLADREQARSAPAQSGNRRTHASAIDVKRAGHFGNSAAITPVRQQYESIG